MQRFINLSHWNKRVHLTHTASLTYSPVIQHPLWSSEISQLFKLDRWHICAISWHIFYRDTKLDTYGYETLVISPALNSVAVYGRATILQLIMHPGHLANRTSGIITMHALLPGSLGSEACLGPQCRTRSHSGASLCAGDNGSLWLLSITQWSKEAYFDCVSCQG